MKYFAFGVALLSIVLSTGCNDKVVGPDLDPTAAPSGNLAADFSVSTSEGIAPLNVRFTNKSTANAVSVSWDFGDGTTSTQRDPAHTFANIGDYSVKLTVSSSTGELRTTSKHIYVDKWVTIDQRNNYLSRLRGPYFLTPTGIGCDFSGRGPFVTVDWSWTPPCAPFGCRFDQPLGFGVSVVMKETGRDETKLESMRGAALGLDFSPYGVLEWEAPRTGRWQFTDEGYGYSSYYDGHVYFRVMGDTTGDDCQPTMLDSHFYFAWVYQRVRVGPQRPR